VELGIERLVRFRTGTGVLADGNALERSWENLAEPLKSIQWRIGYSFH